MLSGIKHFIRRNFSRQPTQWPFVRGEFVVCDAAAPVLVAISGPSSLAKPLVTARPAGLAMVAVLYTPDDTADLLRAIGANLSIQSVICLESDGAKQPLGAALLRLGRGDETPPGAVGAAMNTIASQIDATDLGTLRRRVEFIDLLGCREIAKVVKSIEQTLTSALPSNAGFVVPSTGSGLQRVVLPRNFRYEPLADKAGHFGIRLEEQSIAVEHRNGAGRALRIIEGKTARDICVALIRNGWVSKLDHAAYLGRELARAELALQNGRPFTQDSAEPGGAISPAALER